LNAIGMFVSSMSRNSHFEGPNSIYDEKSRVTSIVVTRDTVTWSANCSKGGLSTDVSGCTNHLKSWAACKVVLH
jgi:hypothetical protein